MSDSKGYPAIICRLKVSGFFEVGTGKKRRKQHFAMGDPVIKMSNGKFRTTGFKCVLIYGLNKTHYKETRDHVNNEPISWA